jgi:hypothetical protein
VSVPLAQTRVSVPLAQTGVSVPLVQTGVSVPLVQQVFEAIAIPVVPVAPAPQRGWTRWCVRAALAVGNMIVNDGHVFF